MSSTQATSQAAPLKSADLENLKQQQLDATSYEDGKGEIEHLKGNTPAGAGYEFPAHEAGLMHLELVTSTPNPQTRKFDDTRKRVTLSPIEFERMEKNESFIAYDEVNILYDCRSKARQKADETGDVRTGSPAEPPRVLGTLNDAQMRYKELTKQDAPTDKTLGWFIDTIAELEAELGAVKTTPDAANEGDNEDAPKRSLRTRADYQARYKELAKENAPADKTIDQLKEAIAHFEKHGTE